MKVISRLCGAWYLVCIHHELDEVWGLEEADFSQVGARQEANQVLERDRENPALKNKQTKIAWNTQEYLWPN